MSIDVCNNSEGNRNSEEDIPNDNVMNDILEEADDTVINCSDTENAGEVNYSITVDEEGLAACAQVIPEVQVVRVRQQAVRVRQVEDDIGSSNLGYSHDSIDVLPVLADLDEQCRHRYSVVIDNFDTSSDEEQDFTEALGAVTSIQRTCTCNCHRSQHTLPSYDNVIMNRIKHSDLILHDDINCNGVSCKSSPSYRTHSRNLLLVHDITQHSPNFTPGNTPGGTRRIAPQMAKILNSASSSPVLGPPQYRSLIFSIIKDEPPKYEEVTGKKLADELIPSSVERPSTRGHTTIRQRVFGVATFLIVVVAIIVLLYLSAEVLDSTATPGGSKKYDKSFKADSNSTAP